MPSALDDRIHWATWAEWCNYMVKDCMFRLRCLEAERFHEGERGRLGLAGMVALGDAINCVATLAEIAARAAADFDEIMSQRVQATTEEELTGNA